MADGNGDLTIAGPTPEQWETARDLVTELKDKMAQLHAALQQADKEHEEFVEELSHYVPDSYDGDGSAESCILQWAKDVDSLAGIVARLTSSYR